jgi:hypothetical protein
MCTYECMYVYMYIKIYDILNLIDENQGIINREMFRSIYICVCIYINLYIYI